jgi:hypothetical protein
VIQSNHIKFRIVKPTGIDLEVYNKYHNSCNQITLTPQDLLQKFPTSTYAGYVVYQSSGAKGLMASDPINIVKAIMDGGIDYPESLPDDTGKWKSGWQIITRDKYPEWRDKWFNLILKNHPDIWFADALRLRKAVEDYSHKKTESSLGEIENLSKNASPDVAKKAKEILEALETIKDKVAGTKEVDTK